MKKILISLALFALAALGFAGATLIPPMAAHADTGAPPVSVDTGDWKLWIGIGLAALGGIRTIMEGIIAVLKVIAPRTKTKADDRAEAFFERMEDYVVRFEDAAGKVLPSAGVKFSAAHGETPPGTQSGFARFGIMAALAVVGIGIMMSSGCASSQRQDVIKAALITVDSARDVFLAFDAAHEHAIVAEATSAEDGKTKLLAYRASRDKVLDMFPVAYHTVAAAALANDDHSLANMQAVLAQLIAAVKPFIGGK